MWYIYKMEYYTAEKKNDSLNFAGKWMELENIILSEVTRHRKTIITCPHPQVIFKHKAKKAILQITIPENLDKNADTKRDLHRSNLHGKQKKTKSPE